MEMMVLKCTLTERQLTERRDKLANQVKDHTELELKKKDMAASFKEKIDALENDMAAVALEIRERAEQRNVEVKRNKNFDEGVEEVIRCDTGEVVETRVLAPHERQAELKLIGAKAKKQETVAQ